MEKSCRYDSKTGPKSKSENVFSALPQLDSEPSDVSLAIKRLESTTAVQRWWRLMIGKSELLSKKMKTRERLQRVHKITFALSLLIRLVVVAYLAVIFFLVAEVMPPFNNDMPVNPAKNGSYLERSVRSDLMKDSGHANIATCRSASQQNNSEKEACINANRHDSQ